MQEGVELSGDVSLEAADDLPLGTPLLGPALDVTARPGVREALCFVVEALKAGQRTLEWLEHHPGGQPPSEG